MQIENDEFLKRLLIHEATFLTTKEKLILLKAASDFEELKNFSLTQISFIVKRNLSRASWNGNESYKKVLLSQKIFSSYGIKCVFFDEIEFPSLLKEINDPPFVLFYRGNLACLEEKCVSIVGTRRASASGIKAAFNFAKDASDENYTVISGLAFGIDVFSHKGSLQGKSARTVAVLPCGIDCVVPSSNKSVAKKILENDGLLLSEYPPLTPAAPFRYVQRNRIIAGLSSSTVVIQSPCGGGAMITADFALNYNRFVFFHSACFDDESQMLNEEAKKRFNKIAAKSKQDSKKMQNKMLLSPQAFVEDGAIVVHNWQEFVDSFANETFSVNSKKNKVKQIDLFN